MISVSDFSGFRGYQVRGSATELSPDAEIYKDGARVSWNDPALEQARADFDGDWAQLNRDNDFIKRAQTKRPGEKELEGLAKRAQDLLAQADLSPRMRSTTLLHFAAAEGLLAEASVRPSVKLGFGKQALGALRGAMASDPSNLAAFKSFAETLLGIDKGTHSGFARLGIAMGQNPEKDTCQGLGIDLDKEIA